MRGSLSRSFSLFVPFDISFRRAYCSAWSAFPLYTELMWWPVLRSAGIILVSAISLAPTIPQTRCGCSLIEVFLLGHRRCRIDSDGSGYRPTRRQEFGADEIW